MKDLLYATAALARLWISRLYDSKSTAPSFGIWPPWPWEGRWCSRGMTGIGRGRVYLSVGGLGSVSSSCLRNAAICFLTICSNVLLSSLSSTARRTRAETLRRDEVSAPRDCGENVQCFLQVREAKVGCEVCDLLFEGVRERYLLVVFQFLLPVSNVQNPLVVGGVVEQTLVG